MKEVFESIQLQVGSITTGLCQIKIVPRNWLENNIEFAFDTGIVSTISLISGKSFLELEMVPESYEYNEKPKESKSGSYYEISISGLLNDYNSSIRQVIETFRYYEMVAIVVDRKKKQRVVGNKLSGLRFSFSDKKTNTSPAKDTLQIDLVQEFEQLPPFYVP